MNLNYQELLLVKQSLKHSIEKIDEILLSEGKIPTLDNLSMQKKVDFTLKAICNYARIQREDLQNKSVRGGMVEWRRISCYILTDYIGLSVTATQKELEYSTHAAVLHHRNNMREWMAEPKFAPRDTYNATVFLLNKLGYEYKGGISRN